MHTIAKSTPFSRQSFIPKPNRDQTWRVTGKMSEESLGHGSKPLLCEYSRNPPEYQVGQWDCLETNLLAAKRPSLKTTGTVA